MADARSKLDILYQEVLGEIHEVIDRVETLKAEIPLVADQAIERMEVQTAMLHAAGERLEGLLETASASSQTQVNQKVSLSRDLVRMILVTGVAAGLLGGLVVGVLLHFWR